MNDIKHDTHEGYIVSLSATGGRLRPFRRRNDLTFEREQAPDFDQLQRHAIVTYRVGPMSILTGRRGAVDVRLLTPQTPPRVLTDPGLLGSADHAEQECLMRRAGIQARWEAGDLSIQQRAALLIDCEFDRANRLSRLESKGVRPPDTADNLIGTNTTDHGQENGMTDRQTGRIDRLTNRGYGFLSVPGTHGAMFFHARAVPTDGGHRFDDLAVGQDVTFILDRDERGRPCATDVRPVASASLPDWPAAQGAQMDDDGDSTTYDWGQSA